MLLGDGKKIAVRANKQNTVILRIDDSPLTAQSMLHGVKKGTQTVKNSWVASSICVFSGHRWGLSRGAMFKTRRVIRERTFALRPTPPPAAWGGGDGEVRVFRQRDLVVNTVPRWQAAGSRD